MACPLCPLQVEMLLTTYKALVVVLRTVVEAIAAGEADMDQVL